MDFHLILWTLGIGFCAALFSSIGLLQIPEFDSGRSDQSFCMPRQLWSLLGAQFSIISVRSVKDAWSFAMSSLRSHHFSVWNSYTILFLIHSVECKFHFGQKSDGAAGRLRGVSYRAPYFDNFRLKSFTLKYIFGIRWFEPIAPPKWKT